MINLIQFIVKKGWAKIKTHNNQERYVYLWDDFGIYFSYGENYSVGVDCKIETDEDYLTKEDLFTEDIIFEHGEVELQNNEEDLHIFWTPRNRLPQNRIHIGRPNTKLNFTNLKNILLKHLNTLCLTEIHFFLEGSYLRGNH